MLFKNYFVNALNVPLIQKYHLDADKLLHRIRGHNHDEAYHCIYDLEPRESFKDYKGVMRPVFGYFWLDLDSKEDGGETARYDAIAFINEFCEGVPYRIFFSGNKGFHIAIPFGLFGLEPSSDLHVKLKQVALNLKGKYPTIDTGVYDPSRRFRVANSLNPKSGLYKIEITDEDLASPLNDIKANAKEPGVLTFNIAPEVNKQKRFTDLLVSNVKQEFIQPEIFKHYQKVDGTAAMTECEFLKYAIANPKQLSNPEWFAVAGVVGRFKDGQKTFHAISKPHPNYTEKETQRTLNTSLSATGPRTCAGINLVWGKCHTCPHFEKLTTPLQIKDEFIIKTEATGFCDIVQQKNGGVKTKPNYNDLLLAFKREHEFKTIVEMKLPFLFNGTHYEISNPFYVKNFAEMRLYDVVDSKRNEFYQKVLANNVTNRGFFVSTIQDKLNFKNGVLDIHTGNILSHSPDYGFRGVLPYAYDPSAQCPNFLNFMNQVLLGDAHLINLVQEYIGYIVRGGDYVHHKALWLSGSGRNGKSTLIDVIKALIGQGNYSTLAVKQVIKDRFAAAYLDGKLANFSEETGPEDLADSGPFKNLTGDGEFDAQHKYGDLFTMRNTAKLVMTFNELLLLKDLSPGMLSRPIIIPFDLDLTDESKQDKNLKSKLMSELPGIFNWAWAGWLRLQLQGAFSKAERSNAMIRDLREISDQAYTWFSECVTIEPAESILPITVSSFACYEHFKENFGDYSLSEQKFYRRLHQIKELEERFFRTKTSRGYKNIRLTDRITR